MSALLLAALLRANLAAGAAVLLILVLRRPVRHRFGALAAYALWLVAPICAAASLIPVEAPPEVLAPVVRLVGVATTAATPLVRRAPDLASILVVAWLAGVIATFGLLAWRQARFVRSLGRLVPSRIDRSLLRAERQGFGPAVIGALRPRIVTPSDFEQLFEPEARDLILAHERVHLARGDAPINALAAALQCAGWFNPLLHLGVRLMQVDQEIACDAAVLARHPRARRIYAETLLNTLLLSRPAPLACHWPATGQHPLMERVTMLNSSSVSPLRKAFGAALVGGLALLGAGAVTALSACAAQPAEQAMITRPVWTERPTGADMLRYYPADAAKAGAGGRAAISCGIAKDGRLEDCVVRNQAPAQYAFGQAALQLSQHFQMKSADQDGKPTRGGKIVIPIIFAAPQS
jgi:TonB family protein